MTNKIKLLMLAILAFTLSGCATDDYRTYTESSISSAKVSSNAYVAKMQALAEIASSQGADSATKASAVMAIAMSQQEKPTELKAPKTPIDLVVPLASIGLQGYLGWLDFFKHGIESTKGSADVDAVIRSQQAATVQFGAQK
jgi:hypothetical protein